jgi:uncharacterized protein YegP (UPF0339 family)
MAFHIYQDASGQWRWYLLSEHHRRIATSAEGYARKSDCLAAVRAILATNPQTPVYED